MRQINFRIPFSQRCFCLRERRAAWCCINAERPVKCGVVNMHLLLPSAELTKVRGRGIVGELKLVLRCDARILSIGIDHDLHLEPHLVVGTEIEAICIGILLLFLGEHVKKRQVELRKRVAYIRQALVDNRGLAALDFRTDSYSLCCGGI